MLDLSTASSKSAYQPAGMLSLAALFPLKSWSRKPWLVSQSGWLTAKPEQRAQLAVGAEPCTWPRILTYPYPLEMLHTPGRITMIYEAENQVRRIFLDRNEHLPFDELDPSYNGDSIGHWEGNTLVIDTIGFNTHAQVWGNLPHSEEMHIVERIRYVDEDTIHNEITITDPLAFKKPIQRTVVYSKRPTWRIREYNCMENNRDAPDVEGKRQGGVVN